MHWGPPLPQQMSVENTKLASLAVEAAAADAWTRGCGHRTARSRRALPAATTSSWPRRWCWRCWRPCCATDSAPGCGNRSFDFTRCRLLGVGRGSQPESSDAAGCAHRPPATRLRGALRTQIAMDLGRDADWLCSVLKSTDAGRPRLLLYVFRVCSPLPPLGRAPMACAPRRRLGRKGAALEQPPRRCPAC